MGVHTRHLAKKTDATTLGDARTSRTSLDARPLGDATDVRARGNGYKNVLDFIITLVVVNSSE
ncbi:uncharacterized protein SETTUDRAFT_20030 [Exserohilum turcica Et28A]|uniref:Uncharacterized protein n=1 Tax=Exserohilum turcicum (strain 28A) TaxID=671987 RepID=R0IGZ6_EXST2|nr:uncharacterized protein SETTUDRAFT_20030 [Exserohilum turcica Et28A]EOA84490.1 hypothetical protein SETTUDRAFT_20030 [Exserohilum turcica Et28A]